MLKSIKTIEYYNKNIIDFNGYINFIYNRTKGNGDKILTSDLTEGFLRFCKVGSFSKDPSIDFEKRRRDMIKDFEKKGFDKLYNVLDEREKIYVSESFSLSYALYNWCDYKQIFKFDPDTFDLIYNQKINDKMDCEFLEKLALPYDTFFIENDFPCEDGSTANVCLFSRSISDYGVTLNMFFFACDDFDENGFPVHLFTCLNVEKGKNVEEVLQSYNITELERERFYKVMNLAMYVSQPKVEILKKKSEHKERNKDRMPKSFYNVSYEENEVGYKMGTAIRNYKYVYEKDENNKNHGSTKKPHVRGGHFHHYWTGVGRTKLIVKFVEPTFVKGGYDKVVPTVHKVK